MRHSAREILRLRSLGVSKYLDTNRTHVFERLHALLSSPLCILLFIFRWWRCAFGSFGGRQTCHPVHMEMCGAPQDTFWVIKIMYSLVNLMDCRYQPHLLVSAMEKNIILSLSLFQSCLSFMNIFRGMMGFQEYGHFVLMLMQV